MSIRVYVNRVLEMNDQLVSYPGTFDNTDGTKLPEDEILDLLEFGIPNTWQKAMLLQDFDPQVHTVNDFVQFCERLETMKKKKNLHVKNIPTTTIVNVNVPVVVLREIIIPTAEAKRKAWTACYTKRTAVIPPTNALYLRSRQKS